MTKKQSEIREYDAMLQKHILESQIDYWVASKKI